MGLPLQFKGSRDTDLLLITYILSVFIALHSLSRSTLSRDALQGTEGICKWKSNRVSLRETRFEKFRRNFLLSGNKIHCSRWAAGTMDFVSRTFYASAAF